MNANTCPKEEDLYAIIAGEGHDADRTHVATCHHCQAQLRKLNSEATILKHIGETSHRRDADTPSTDFPRTIGKFIVVGVWNDAPTLITYRGLHAVVRRDVLIHVAKSPLCENSLFQKAFELASGRWMQPRPDVAQVLDAGEYESRPYLVVEYNDGVRLDRLTGEAQLDAPTLMRIFSQIAQALAADESTPHPRLNLASIVVDETNQPMLVDWAAAAEFCAGSCENAEESSNGTSRRLAITFCNAVLSESHSSEVKNEMSGMTVLSEALIARKVPRSIAELMAKTAVSEMAKLPSLTEISHALSLQSSGNFWKFVFGR